MDKTAMAVEIFDRRASEYQDKYMDVNLYHNSLDLFCEQIEPKHATLLELACGPGNITQYLLKQRPDFKILGTDLSLNMIKLAQANNPTADFQLMDCRAISKIKNRYHAIMCGFCLPYLCKEESIQLIKDAAQLLERNGVFYLSTMADDYSQSGFQTSSSGNDRMYIHYHQADYLSQALKESGFTILDLCHQDFPTNDEKKIRDLIIVAKKA